jgi:hypothetical protein
MPEDLGKIKTAMLSLGIVVGVAALGGIAILTLPHMLNALAGLPLWACYGIVGGLLAISGGLLLIGKNTSARIDVVPPHTMETLKESVQWITERTTSDGTSKARVPR